MAPKEVTILAASSLVVHSRAVKAAPAARYIALSTTDNYHSFSYLLVIPR
jgi:hypothetical protein